LFGETGKRCFIDREFLVVISCPLAANRRIEIANYTNRLLPGKAQLDVTEICLKLDEEAII
jgi:hypothetical protein